MLGPIPALTIGQNSVEHCSKHTGCLLVFLMASTLIWIFAKLLGHLEPLKDLGHPLLSTSRKLGKQRSISQDILIRMAPSGNAKPDLTVHTFRSHVQSNRCVLKGSDTVSGLRLAHTSGSERAERRKPKHPRRDISNHLTDGHHWRFFMALILCISSRGLHNLLLGIIEHVLNNSHFCGFLNVRRTMQERCCMTARPIVRAVILHN